ncbi:MAG: peptide chain release factor 3, partial [Bdellovibrionales bacterium]|nr:peptide chain release factor 3 [Bdellovibrionales bacterium]
INLLDTPGHKDFGEDTYRTLIAADSAAMLIDAAKGVEAQTRKLYEVCRMRKMPIMTFANKMDREGKSPLELIDDVESTLGMSCYPVTWPVGMGDRFKGLYHRLQNKLYVYTKGEEKPQVIDVKDWRDPVIGEGCDEFVYSKFLEEVEIIEGVLGEFDREKYLKGELSPMSFGSAKFNWGVDHFLSLFAQHAPAPLNRKSKEGEISPFDNWFTGFVFKIQANMDKKHRDRVAFFRICSGKFDRGMKVRNTRTNRELRLAYANQFMAQERETVDEAYAGDILGINDTGNFQIGDAVSTGKDIHFDDIPRFSPEHFGRVSIKEALKKKQLEKGIQQLVEEGAIQIFFDPLVGMQDPILGAVGELQFDVLMYRLRDEYGLEARFEKLPYTVARWLKTESGEPYKDRIDGDVRVYHDRNEQPVILLEREWSIKWIQDRNPKLILQISS